LKCRFIAYSFLSPAAASAARAAILLFPVLSVKHFGRPAGFFSPGVLFCRAMISYVNPLVRFMHFHSVENSVQKVENPPAFKAYSFLCHRIFILFHPIIQNSVNLFLYFARRRIDFPANEAVSLYNFLLLSG
jgi:hypothetical protein